MSQVNPDGPTSFKEEDSAEVPDPGLEEEVIIVSSDESGRTSPSAYIRMMTGDECPARQPDSSQLSEGEGDVLEDLFRNPSSLLALDVVNPRTSGPESPFSRLRAGGVAWLVLRSLYNVGSLEISPEQASDILHSSTVLRGQIDVLGVALATVQALASQPLLRDLFSRWVVSAPNPGDIDLDSSLGLGANLRPWEEEILWSFDSWALVMAILPRFIAKSHILCEQEFLEMLSDLNGFPGVFPWKVETIVATLYVVKSSYWFWPLLL